MRILDKKIQETFIKIQKWILGGAAFWSFAAIGSHVHENEKKKIEKSNHTLKISKIQDSTFVRTTEKKIQKKFEKIQMWSEGGVAFWSVCSHRVEC